MIRNIKETIKTIIIAGLLAIAARSMIVEHCRIPSPSMVPSFLIGDHLFVSKYAYGISGYSFPLAIKYFEGRVFDFHKPQRGDVIVFRLPENKDIYYIKRLIGIPGDEIQLIDGNVYLNGEKLTKKYEGNYVDPDSKEIFKKYTETLPGGKSYNVIEEDPDHHLNNTHVFKVPENHYFFMGDNRHNSLDSRVLYGKVGFVPYENLVGRADYVLFSNPTPIWQIWKWFFTFRPNRFWLDAKKL